jgi:hypothetical protein
MKNNILLLVIIFSLVVNIYHHRSAFTTPYDLAYWQKQFSYSQIVIGDKAPYFFSDSEVYSIVGYKYITGEDPMHLHTEAPPLGKEIIGLSILLFNNPNVINLLLFISILFLLFLISRYIGISVFGSLLAVFLVLLDPLMWSAVIEPLLDISQLFFLSLALLAFLKSLTCYRWLIICQFAVGFMMATKFYFNGLILLGVFCLAAALANNFRFFIRFILTLPLIALAYMLPYLVSFKNGAGLWEFIKFQRWLTTWWAGNARVPWGGIFPIIFSGQWLTWWGKKLTVPVPEWSLLWPATLITGLLSLRNNPSLVVWLWSVVYLVFISCSSPFPRYLVALYPFWVILALRWFTINKCKN